MDRPRHWQGRALRGQTGVGSDPVDEAGGIRASGPALSYIAAAAAGPAQTPYSAAGAGRWHTAQLGPAAGPEPTKPEVKAIAQALQALKQLDAQPLRSTAAWELPMAPAVDRAVQALQAFVAHQGPLTPHFTYGALAKPAYTRAHLMHLADHWQVFTP